MQNLYEKLASAGVTMVRRELELYGPKSLSAMFPELFPEPEDVPTLAEMDEFLNGCCGEGGCEDCKCHSEGC